jgi:hypothetical protein
MSDIRVGDRVVVLKSEEPFKTERGTVRAVMQRNALIELGDGRRHWYEEHRILEWERTEPAPTPAPAADTINHPPHYAGKVECIDAIEAATDRLEGIEAVCTGNAVKYLWRWKRKGGVEDLRKAKWYLERLIAHLEGAA